MERARINSNQKLTPAVAFPSSYPFSLLATLPESPRPGKSSMPHETVFIPGLGEIAIVNHTLRTASIVALTRLQVIHLTPEAITELSSSIPAFGEAVRAAAAARVGHD